MTEGPRQLTLHAAGLRRWALRAGGWVPGLPLLVRSLQDGGTIADGTVLDLRHPEGVPLGRITVRQVEAHPEGSLVDGEVEVHRSGVHYDHPHLRVDLGDLAADPADLAVPLGGVPPVRALDALLTRVRAQSARVTVLTLGGTWAPDDPDGHTLVLAHAAIADHLRAAGVAIRHALTPLHHTDPIEWLESAGARVARKVVLPASAGADATPTSPAEPRGVVWLDHELHRSPRAALAAGDTSGDVADLLARRIPTGARRGVTVLLTGLSGSGKSTVAGAVMARLHATSDRRVTLLDGDLVRTHLSSELGFSRAHRDLNVTRIGFVAAEVTKHGGVAISAPIAPYAATRQRVRQMVEQVGEFVLVHVATPLEVCEARDRKGLYAKARRGEIEGFTGISDPYEAPEDADVVIDTAVLGVDEAADAILAELFARGLL